MTLTLTIIIITALLSFTAFNNPKIMQDLIFHPPAIIRNNQYYRFITSGFIHADINHLLFNMLTLYFFGKSWENIYIGYLGIEKYMFLVLYLSAMIVADIPSFIKNKNNYRYYSLGASGAVSAIVFSMILIAPWSMLYVFFLPVPAIIYAVLYLAYSVYMDRKGGDNINHGAHLWGAIFGVVFTLIIKPEVAQIFLERLLNPSF